jgi:hypothetical protein
MGRSCFVIPVFVASLSAATGANAQTADRRPALEVVVDNRSSVAGLDLAAARARARFIFGEAGIRITFLTQGSGAALAASEHDRIHLVVIEQPEADRLIAGDVTRLGFALPSANRVYVHYDRIRALATDHRVQPGWFLGVVMVHELAHVLQPQAGHADSGIMARSLSPDPKVLPAFTREEARALRERLGEETTMARR